MVRAQEKDQNSGNNVEFGPIFKKNRPELVRTRQIMCEKLYIFGRFFATKPFLPTLLIFLLCPNHC